MSTPAPHTTLRHCGVYELPDGRRHVAVQFGTTFHLYRADAELTRVPSFTALPDGRVCPWHSACAYCRVTELRDTGATWQPGGP